jgi:hypothetical protein
MGDFGWSWTISFSIDVQSGPGPQFVFRLARIDIQRNQIMAAARFVKLAKWMVRRS